MMVYAYFLFALQGEGVFRRQVLWMKVVGHGGGVDVKNSFEMIYSLLKGGQGFKVLQIPDMMAQEGEGAPGETECVF